jgi:hypothetical protein
MSLLAELVADTLPLLQICRSYGAGDPPFEIPLIAPWEYLRVALENRPFALMQGPKVMRTFGLKTSGAPGKCRNRTSR